jgi:hypothetical protein
MKHLRGRIGLVALIPILLIAAIFVFRARFGPGIRQAHTLFCFSQLDQAYRHSTTSGLPPATNSQRFIERIPQWTIDWNSCHFRDLVIYDAWGTPAEVHVEASQIILRSAGADRVFDTPDDISRQFPQ